MTSYSEIDYCKCGSSIYSCSTLCDKCDDKRKTRQCKMTKASVASSKSSVAHEEALRKAARGAADEIDLFYRRAELNSGTFTISEDSHDLWFHRDELLSALGVKP